MRWLDRAIWAAALLATGLVGFSALAQSPGSFTTLQASGNATLNGDVLACSGRPWVDVRCPGLSGGAVGDGSHDDTAALAAGIAAAVAGNYPLHVPAGTYRVSSKLTIDYAGQSGSGFRLISEGAVIDGRGIASGPVLQVQCSGGSTASPANCFYFKEEGTLSVLANTPAYAVVVGKPDFSDAHNSIKLDHLVVNNANTGSGAGACQLNYVLDSDVFAVCDSAGGAAGLALEQTQFSRLAGAGSASGTGGASLVMENGYDFSNTVAGFDFEVSPTCLSITFNHDGQNTFVSPYFNCVTAVSATASTHNLLLNPNYGGDVVNRGLQSVGIQVVGNGNWAQWQFPAVASYTATGVDTGTVVSSYNAPGSSLAITLPAPGSVGAGWWMGFATDNGKGMSITAPTGAILSGGKAVSAIALGAGDYEYLQLQSDGNNFRVVTSTRNTQTGNGFASRDWPGNWLYPSAPGYAVSLLDNGTMLSSANTAAGLTVTLPATANLPSGWSLGLATDNGKGVTVQVNGTGGGHILYPKGAASAVTALSLAGYQYEVVTLHYDGSGNFRVEQATPATAQQLGMAGTAGFSRWSFPAASAYTATLADNGNVVSSYNTPLGYMAVTLPATEAISAGWTLGLATDNGKTMAVQVSTANGGKILMPGTLGAQTSLSLFGQNYEFVGLMFDGSNFRVISVTPATASSQGMLPATGTPASSAAACQTGQLQFDSNYLYACTAPNSWKRAAWSSF
ncbi:MAG: hypothetical protein JO038_01355 [Alphaproteobacteria bacterium]|nr:hypothetical protein [Alphaproteobacteria bacterium]